MNDWFDNKTHPLLFGVIILYSFINDRLIQQQITKEKKFNNNIIKKKIRDFSSLDYRSSKPVSQNK